MSQDDLGTWLKASAENKITSRNAWQATLIEHFVDSERFTAPGGVNFQRASSTLEGCMKVYSTRVDDVSDNTLKLLEIFNKDDERKKTVNKKKHNFIEKNLANINLKERDPADFYDPVFSSILMKSDEYFLMDIVESRSRGMMVYGCGRRELVMEDNKIEISVEQLPICQSLKDIEAVIGPQQILEAEYVEDMDMIDFEIDREDIEDANREDIEDVDREDVEDVDREDVEDVDREDVGALKEGGVTYDHVMETVTQGNTLNVFNETPFGYFKGWAGPTHWKVQLGAKTKKETTKKPRQQHFLDFTAQIDQSQIENKTETVLSKQSILERRKNKNFLPEDYAYEAKDLYKFQKLDGYFCLQTSQTSEGNVEVLGVDRDDSACFDTNVEFDNQNIDNFPTDLLARSEIVPEPNSNFQLKFTRIPKKINIKQLKDRLSVLLGQDCYKFSQIVHSLPETYEPNEAKDISPHFCLISLLHLANEAELELKTVSGDLVISKI